MRAEPATLTPTLSHGEREGETTCFLSQLPGRKALMRAEPATLAPALSRGERGKTTSFLLALSTGKALMKVIRAFYRFPANLESCSLFNRQATGGDG